MMGKMNDAMKADVQKKLDDAPPGKAKAERFTRQVRPAEDMPGDDTHCRGPLGSCTGRPSNGP